MAVKKGFKQTEVGVIPEDWQVTSIGSAFEICNQQRLPLSQTVREKMSGPYPYYGPTSIQSWINEFRFEGKYSLIGEDGDHFLKWRNQKMTLLVNGQFNVNNHAHAIRGVRNVTEWFYWFFAYRDITQHLTRQGAGRFKLTKAALASIPMALPPFAEQEVIAGALSDADAWIESLEQLIAKKRQIKQGATQELLMGKRRLPGFNGEWDTKRLGDVVKIIKGSLITSNKLIQGEVPVIAGGKQPAYYHAIANRFGKTITISASGASAGYVAIYNKPIFASDCSTIGESEQYCIEFIFYTLQAKQLLIYEAQTGGAQPHIHAKDLNPILCKLPLKVEQTAIATVLSDMDTEIESLESKLAKAREIKQGMMQELLTGRIRLVN